MLPCRPLLLGLMDPYLFIMTCLFASIADKGHFGWLDYANPLYWLSGLSLMLNMTLFQDAGNYENSWGLRLLAGAGAALLLPLTAVIVLATLLTTHLWTLAKAAVVQ